MALGPRFGVRMEGCRNRRGLTTAGPEMSFFLELSHDISHYLLTHSLFQTP